MDIMVEEWRCTKCLNRWSGPLPTFLGICPAAPAGPPHHHQWARTEESADIPKGGVSEQLLELLLSVGRGSTTPRVACARLAKFIVQIHEAKTAEIARLRAELTRIAEVQCTTVGFIAERALMTEEQRAAVDVQRSETALPSTTGTKKGTDK